MGGRRSRDGYRRSGGLVASDGDSPATGDTPGVITG